MAVLVGCLSACTGHAGSATVAKFVEPTGPQLQEGLLAAGDVGPPYSFDDSLLPGGALGLSISGCPGLLSAFGPNGPIPNGSARQAGFNGGPAGPVVLESLVLHLIARTVRAADRLRDAQLPLARNGIGRLHDATECELSVVTRSGIGDIASRRW